MLKVLSMMQKKAVPALLLLCIVGATLYHVVLWLNTHEQGSSGGPPIAVLARKDVAAPAGLLHAMLQQSLPRRLLYTPFPLLLGNTTVDFNATVVFDDADATEIETQQQQQQRQQQQQQQQQQQPKKMVIAIVTHGRTGSTFTGEILNSHPAVFYVDEPLHVYDGANLVPRAAIVGKTRAAPDAATATSIKQQILRNVFACDYDARYMAEYVRYNRNQRMTRNFARTRVIREMLGCGGTSSSSSVGSDEARLLSCPIDRLTSTHLHRACTRYATLAAKILRVSVGDMNAFVNDHRATTMTKIVYLVRDPRGVVNSQLGTGWFTSRDQARQVAQSARDTCRSMLAGLEQSDALPEASLLVLRYEDMAMAPHVNTARLLAFAGLNMTVSVRRHIDSHTHGKSRSYRQHDWFSVRPNSTATALAWKTTFPRTYRELVERTPDCATFIKRMGYDKL